MQPTKRARSAEAKQERAQLILDVSSDILSKIPLNDFTMAEVAARTKLSKPAIYNYFATREEILLAIYRNLLKDWMSALNSAVTAQSPEMDKDTFDALYVKTFLENPLLAKLTPQLTSTLEQNITAKTYNEFKLETAELTEQFAALLVSIGRASQEDCHHKALSYMTVIVGALHVAAPVPFAPEELTETVASFMSQIDFEANCLNTLKLLH